MAITMLKQIKKGFASMEIPVHYIVNGAKRLLGTVIWNWYTPDEEGYQAFLEAGEKISYQDFLHIWRQRKTDCRNEFSALEKSRQGITETSSSLINKRVYEALTSNNPKLVTATMTYLNAQDATLTQAGIIADYEERLKNKKRVKRIPKVHYKKY